MDAEVSKLGASFDSIGMHRCATALSKTFPIYLGRLVSPSLAVACGGVKSYRPPAAYHLAMAVRDPSVSVPWCKLWLTQGPRDPVPFVSNVAFCFSKDTLCQWSVEGDVGQGRTESITAMEKTRARLARQTARIASTVLQYTNDPALQT